MFTATKKQRGKTVWFSFAVSQRRVTCYYFYVWDDDFGPAFVKVCAYFPYPMKIWVNGQPNLQVGGQVVSFLTAHLGYEIPSPAILEKIGTAFRKAGDRFASDNKIPVVRFGKNDR